MQVYSEEDAGSDGTLGYVASPFVATYFPLAMMATWARPAEYVFRCNGFMSFTVGALG